MFKAPNSIAIAIFDYEETLPVTSRTNMPAKSTWGLKKPVANALPGRVILTFGNSKTQVLQKSEQKPIHPFNLRSLRVESI